MIEQEACIEFGSVALYNSETKLKGMIRFFLRTICNWAANWVFSIFGIL